MTMVSRVMRRPSRTLKTCWGLSPRSLQSLSGGAAADGVLADVGAVVEDDQDGGVLQDGVAVGRARLHIGHRAGAVDHWILASLAPLDLAFDHELDSIGLVAVDRGDV